MHKIEEVLRLRFELKRSHRQIARSIGAASSTVADYLRRFTEGGSKLAAAGCAVRERTRGSAVPPSAQGGAERTPRARLGGIAHRDAPARGDAHAVVAGI